MDDSDFIFYIPTIASDLLFERGEALTRHKNLDPCRNICTPNNCLPDDVDAVGYLKKMDYQNKLFKHMSEKGSLEACQVYLDMCEDLIILNSFSEANRYMRELSPFISFYQDKSRFFCQTGLLRDELEEAKSELKKNYSDN